MNWPSIDECKPEEEGGPIARTGFNYQDEIAVGFLIEMLEAPELEKIHCETHDDIVLVRNGGTGEGRAAEYVQVKATEQDKLWSVADLSLRKKSKEGTSVFEISLGRDQHEETSTFRLVTLRPVVSELKVLTYPRNSPSRLNPSNEHETLCTELRTRFPSVASPKGNDVCFWVSHCYWDERHSEDAVRKDNLIRLVQLASKEGRPILFEPAELLLLELRRMAKEAGDAKWDPDRNKKIISRAFLRSWWDKRLDELRDGAASPSGGKLSAKMNDANLPPEIVGLAIELRRDYATEVRSPRYMDLDEVSRLQRRVRSEVMTLRSRLIAGQIALNGQEFHALCVERMDSLNAERGTMAEDRSAFLKGCMYDIADRCLLRFARQP